ncbi:hypothetical protein UlMin_002903 [Ulmus minor]
MLENPTTAVQGQPGTADPAPVTKRYAPPNQRNRSLNRRKSADRYDRTTNAYGSDVEKNQVTASSGLQNENPRSSLIALEGCSNSVASQLMNDRWAAAMQSFNDPSIDPSEKPVMFAEKPTSAWGQYRLPHQFMAPTGGAASPGSQMDFLAELRRQMSNSSASLDG